MIEFGFCRPGAGAVSDDDGWVLLVHAVPLSFGSRYASALALSVGPALAESYDFGQGAEFRAQRTRRSNRRR